MMVGGKDDDTMVGANLYRLTEAERKAAMYVGANMNVMHGDLGDNFMAGVGQMNAMSAGRYKETVFFNLAASGQWWPFWSLEDAANTFSPLYNFEGLGNNTMVGIATVDNKMWAGDGNNQVVGIALGESWGEESLWPPFDAPTLTTITGKNRIRLGEGHNTVLGFAVDGKIEARGGNNWALGIASKTNDVIANGNGNNWFFGAAYGRGMHQTKGAPYPEFMGVNRIGVQNGNNHAAGFGGYNFMLAVEDITERVRAEERRARGEHVALQLAGPRRIGLLLLEHRDAFRQPARHAPVTQPVAPAPAVHGAAVGPAHAGAPAHAAPQLCQPSAAKQRRPARCARVAGPRQHQHDAGVYQARPSASGQGV